MPNTVRLHRVFKAPPQRVYKAFTDADAMAKWLPPYGFSAAFGIGPRQHIDRARQDAQFDGF